MNSHREEVKVIIQENKVKKRHIFERFWGFKMSIEDGSDQQQAGFLITAAISFPHGNKILQDIYLIHRLPCFLFHL